MKNIKPGPDIFDATKNPDQATLVYAIFVTFVLANLMLVPLGMVAIRVSSWLVQIPRRVLLPIIVLFCIVGSYAMNGSYFDVTVMAVMGVVGFILESFRVPLGPVVLGIILGKELEHKFIQCIQKSPSAEAFFSSPISLLLGLVCLLLWVAPLLLRWKAPLASGSDS